MDKQDILRQIIFCKREIKNNSTEMKKYMELRAEALAAANEELEVSLNDFYIKNPDSIFCSCRLKDWDLYEECPELIEPIMKNWEYMQVHYVAAQRYITKLNRLEKELTEISE